MNRREFIRDAGTLSAALSLPYAIAANATQAEKIATRPIPGSGEQLPIVGFGNSGPLRDGDYDIARGLLDVLLEKGGSFVDTWAANQNVLGRYMRENAVHSSLFLGTNIAAGDAQDSDAIVQKAREIQGKEILDLLQVPNPADVELQWRLLRRAKDNGHTRYIGIAIARSRYYEIVESLIASGTADFVQLNYSLLEPESGERLLPLARDKGVAVVTNRPFVNGQYFPLVKDRALPEWAADFDCHSWAQFSLKYILANSAVNCVITETSNPKHAIDNMSAGFGRLPDDTTRARMRQLVQSF
jgi:diketogulonate reductase-like aldo/keto reductase